MRSLVVAAAAALLLPTAASGKTLDPARLVLRLSDLPAGFRVDRDETGLRSNAREARSDPRLPRLFARWERLTGYQAQYDRGGQTVASRVDVFRSRQGAAGFLAWYAAELRRSGIGGLRRSPLRLGDGGWLYQGAAPTIFFVAVWREGRVFAGAVGLGLERARVLGLARVQQRRIAAALR